MQADEQVEAQPTEQPLRIIMLTTFYPPHNFGGDGIGIQRLARGRRSSLWPIRNRD